ncbi:hypothetical protein AAG906_011573 [Vitis piasezkii]
MDMGCYIKGKMSEVSRGGRSWLAVEAKSFEIVVEVEEEKGSRPGISLEMRACNVCWVESRPIAGIMEIGSGLLTGRRREGNIDWNIKGTAGGVEHSGGEIEEAWSGASWRCKVSTHPRSSAEGEGVVSSAWWGNSAVPIPELDFLRRWVKLSWLPKESLRIAMLGRGLLLFEFETMLEAKENFLCLEKWNPEVGCFQKEFHANEAWVRVLGLPLHLWSREVVVGSGCFFVLLWWEFPPWFVHVVPLRGSHVDGLTMAREEEDGGAAFVAARSTGVQVVGTVEAREEGCIGRNGLTVRCYMSCRCNSSVMGNESEALGSQVGGEGSGLGGLESLGSQPLNGLGSLKRGGREAQERTEMEREGEKGDLASMSLEEVIRAAATDEALLSEASRYGDVSLLARGRGFFSPSSSFLGQTLVKDGSFGLGKGKDAVSEGNLVPLREQMSSRLLMIECDSQDKMMGVRREDAILYGSRRQV